jgi:integrase
MQQVTDSVNEYDASAGASTETGPRKVKQRATLRGGMQNFIHWEREKQLQAFFAWLPQELHDAPGVRWTQLPAKLMGYCLRTIRNSPDAAHLALAAGTMPAAMNVNSQYKCLIHLYRLLRSLRAGGFFQHLDDLKQEQTWHNWAAHWEKTPGMRIALSVYGSVTSNHFPRYLLRLTPQDRLRMQRYALPLLPSGLIERYFPSKELRSVQRANRKAVTDILVPLYPIMRQLIRFRKQVAERTLLAIRAAQLKVEAREATLPYRFHYIETIPEINHDARSISEVQVQGREVTMKWVLWDKATWVQHHPERYSAESIRCAREGQGSYSRQQNCLFVQFDGKASDLLWFGDLVEHAVLQRFDKHSLHPEGYQERWDYARRLGFSKGCFTGRPGLLTPGDPWFASATDRGGELLIEFESLYRGILFGAALAMLALSNGSRVSELLQVSWNKERRITRTETIVLVGEDGQPQRGNDGRSLTKQVKLHFQLLLPKGAKTEEERQLFPLSTEALRLLGEIKTLLEKTYGDIPIVEPAPSNSKREHLKAERYLFQWDASPDGKVGTLAQNDVITLLRVILHGLDVTTTQGEPIRVTPHVLRHLMSTHARHYRHVPPEAIAYFFLHHRLTALTGREPSLTDISEYYTQTTEKQRFASISADLDEQEEMDQALLPAAPTPRELEQMNEDLRIVFELWHALHPTAFGYCGCPGLCPRGNDRALCLGCSYLVTDPERLGAALSWRESYVKQVELFEAQGNALDARQARIKVQLLDDVINVMRLQLQAEADGSYIPVYKVLSSPHRKSKEEHETEN